MRFGMRPARYASRPARHACFIARAMRTGSCACVMPVCRMTPSMPSSIATATSRIDTHCPYCALNCGLHLEVDDGRVTGTARWKGSPLTGGALCSKGVSAFEQVDHPERITAPLRRVGDDFAEIGWDEGLAEMVDWARSSGFKVVAAGKGTKYLPAYHKMTPGTAWPLGSSRAVSSTVPRRLS